VDIYAHNCVFRFTYKFIMEIYLVPPSLFFVHFDPNALVFTIVFLCQLLININSF